MGRFRGLGVAMITPFRNGKIDDDALAWLILNLINNGVGFLVPCGTTGESPTLSHQEQKNIIKFTVDIADGRVPVLAGTGSNSTQEAVEMTQAAKECGADGAMAVVPYYNKPTELGIIEHYEKLSRVGLPIILYDIPGRTGIKVSSETIIRLSSNNLIDGIKWASGDLHQLEDIIMNCPENFDILSGNDDQALDLMIRGGHGVISVIGNIIPDRFSRLITLMQEEAWGNSRNMHMRLVNLMRVMFIESNPAPVKAALSIMHPKIFTDELRLPMCGLTTANLQELVHELEGNGLYKQR
jgi:4-hydroxy-tetrahydrodipicolinate synthase